jgi:hypothetical protein
MENSKAFQIKTHNNIKIGIITMYTYFFSTKVNQDNTNFDIKDIKNIPNLLFLLIFFFQICFVKE